MRKSVYFVSLIVVGLVIGIYAYAQNASRVSIQFESPQDFIEALQTDPVLSVPNDDFGAGFVAQAVDLIGSQSSYEAITGGYGGAGSASSTDQRVEGLENGRLFVAFRPTSNSTGTIAFRLEFSDDGTYWYPLSQKATSTNARATSTKVAAPLIEEVIMKADDGNTEATTTFETITYRGAKWMRVFARYLDTDGDNNEDGTIWVRHLGIENIVR